jgi:hypothetical protein
MTHRLNKMKHKVMESATPRGIIIAISLYLVSIAVLTLSDARITALAPEFSKPDLQFGYDFAYVLAALTILGDVGRSAYGVNLIIDSVMPVLFAAATVLVVARAAPRWWLVLSIAPLTFMVLDVVENVSFGLMLFQFPDIAPALVISTSLITMVKLSAFVVALPTLILGALLVIFQWWRSLNRSSLSSSLK